MYANAQSGLWTAGTILLPAGGAPVNDWDAKGWQKAGLRGAPGCAMCGTAQKKGPLGRKLTPMTNGFFSD